MLILNVDYPIWFLIFSILSFLNHQLLKPIIDVNELTLVGIAILQSVWISSVMSLVYSGIKLKAGQGGRTFSFILIIYVVGFYGINCVLFNLMNMPLTMAFSMLNAGRWEDFLVTIRATQIPEQTFYKLGVVFVALGVLVKFLLKISDRIVRFKPININELKFFLKLFVLSASLTVLSQYGMQKKLDPTQYETALEGLILTPELFSPNTTKLRLKVSLLPYKRSDKVKEVENDSFSNIPENANVFYFVAESLRGDFVTEDIMPSLFKFSEENTSFKYPRSNSNATHLSWHSMHLSEYPMYWPIYHSYRFWSGSSPIQSFIRAGFKVHVFTKKINQKFFNSHKMYYGSNEELLSTTFVAEDSYHGGADQQIIEATIKAVEKEGKSGRNLYIVYLDGAHHNYKWPSTFKPVFVPIIDSFQYYRFNYGPEEVEGIRNRYKNCLRVYDNQFNYFFTELKRLGVYEDSRIAIVGDHAEEFMEHESLIHSANLYNTNIEVGLFMKVPQLPKSKMDAVMSQINVLPTLLDSVGAYSEKSPPNLQGTSVISNPDHLDFALSFASCGTIVPDRAVITTKFGKLFFDFDDKTPLLSDYIKIVGLTDNQDIPMAEYQNNPELLKKIIQKEFLPHLKKSKLFSHIDFY